MIKHAKLLLNSIKVLFGRAILISLHAKKEQKNNTEYHLETKLFCLGAIHDLTHETTNFKSVKTSKLWTTPVKVCVITHTEDLKVKCFPKISRPIEGDQRRQRNPRGCMETLYPVQKSVQKSVECTKTTLHFFYISKPFHVLYKMVAVTTIITSGG